MQWVLHSAPPDPVAGFNGLTSKGEGGEGKGGRGESGKGGVVSLLLGDGRPRGRGGDFCLG